MKTILNKTILLLFALFHFMFASGQERYDVTLINDTVYNNGIPQFLCKENKSEKGDMYSLRSMDNKLQGLLICRFENDKIKFSGTFPYLEVRYSCLYPQMEILTLMESYVRNKVFVKDKPSLEGLKDYCKVRGIELVKQVKRTKPNPATRDSIMAANAREDAKNQVKFTFHNNAPKPVRIFIGNKPKGGSGRVQVIAPYGDLKEHARKTEKIFLLNDAGDEIQSLLVTDSLKRIVIKASGDGFE